MSRLTQESRLTRLDNDLNLTRSIQNLILTFQDQAKSALTHGRFQKLVSKATAKDLDRRNQLQSQMRLRKHVQVIK